MDVKNKLVIQKNNSNVQVFVYQNGELVEQYQEQFDDKRLEGNIYLGKVTDVVKGMQSAFVNIGTGKNAFIHIKDIIPRESSITGNENIDISKYNISDIIKPNDEIIVQIKRDCNNNKGPRVTKDIKLVGKYAILMPFSKFVTVSKKITDAVEKKRLIKITNEVLNKHNNFGIILRTSAENKEEDLIQNDIEDLIEKWNNILEKAKKVDVPFELYTNNGIIGKLITDFEPLGLEIYTNSEEIKDFIKQIDENVNVELVSQIDEEFNLERKVYLKCGGFITIDVTEALVAIDVNSGKFTGKNELEDTILKVNMEAAQEIAKQIRLRDLGGIIIIDFIDMENEQDREKVKQKMQEEIKKDRSKVQILEFTKLDLLEITRKHILGK